jgi:hypothetical protein
MTAGGTTDYTKLFDGTFAGYVENGVAASTGGRYAWFHFRDGDTFSPEYRLSVFANAGTPVWSLDRGQTETVDFEVVGPNPEDASMSSAGQLVVGGRFESFTFSGGWIQAFAP